jgi:hypothetical protein
MSVLTRATPHGVTSQKRAFYVLIIHKEILYILTE